MTPSVRDRVAALLALFPAALARLGIVEREKASAAFDLAVPAMVTGGLRTLVRASDFFMVSVASGGAAVAALELGFQYYFVPFGLSLALTSGTISVVSRLKGAGADARADLAIKQSLWLALAMAVPITAATWVYAEPMIGVLTASERTIELGATYLRIVMLGVSFRFWGMIAARALAGAGDTKTPMYVRSITLPANVVLNAVLIFGLGPAPALGIAGAAWGTTAANALAAGVFAVLLLRGTSGVRFRPHGRQVDAGLLSELVRVGLPLAGTRLSRTFGRFPFLFVLGVLGTDVIAAYAIGRRVMLLALMPAWGYSTAASTLVGQHVGAGEEAEATAYGWQTLRIALATQLLVAAALVVGAEPLARAFQTEYVDLTVAFVRVFGLGVAGFSISRTMRGGLRGAGDTRWPFYGGLLGTYVVRLPLAALALPAGFAVALGPVAVGPVTLGGFSVGIGAGLGLAAVYAAIIGDMYARAAVNLARFHSGAWRAVARANAAGAD